MDAPGAIDRHKKEDILFATMPERKTYYLVYGDQTEPIKQEEYNALKKQSLTLNNILNDCDEDSTNIPVGIDPKKVTLALPFLSLLHQHQISLAKEKLEKTSTHKLVEILNTANFLDCKDLLRSAVGAIKEKPTKKFLEAFKKDQERSNHLHNLPIELSIFIGTSFCKTNLPMKTFMLQKLGLYGTFHCNDLDEILFYPDGKRIAIRVPCSIEILNAHTAEKVGTIGSFWHNPIQGEKTKFSTDGTTVAEYEQRDKVTKIRDAKKGNYLSTTINTGPLTSFTLSPDGKQLATVHNFIIRIWDTKSQNCVREITDYTTGHVHSVNFFPDGKKLLAIYEIGDARIYDSQNGQRLTKLKGRNTKKLHTITFSPDGQMLAAKNWTESNKVTHRIWSANSGKCLKTYNLESSISPDGLDLGLVFPDGTAELHKGGKEKVILVGEDKIHSVHFCPDKETVATISEKYIATIRNNQTGQEILSLENGPCGGVHEVKFSNDGKMMASHHNWKAKIWNLKTIKDGDTFFNEYITFEQALFLQSWYQSIQDKEPFDFSTHLQPIYNSLPPKIQEVVRQNKPELTIVGSIKSFCKNMPGLYH